MANNRWSGGASASVPSTARTYADDEKITEITKEVLDLCMDARKWQTQAHRHISFRGDAFNLRSIDGLLRQQIDLTCLESFDVSDNSLEEVHCVEGRSSGLKKDRIIQGHYRFQSLRVFKARRNELTEFVAVLPPLRELDLGKNRIMSLPPTTGFPSLEVLILSHNLIDGSWAVLSHLENLRKLDLSDNRFNFSPSDLSKEIDTLASLHHLVSLKIKDNIFASVAPNGGCFPEYQTLVLQRLRQLHELDDLSEKTGTEGLEHARRTADAAGTLSMLEYDQMVFRRQKVISQSHMNRQSDLKSEPPMPCFTELLDAIQDGLEDPPVISKTIKQIVRISSKMADADPKKIGQVWRDIIKKANKRKDDITTSDVADEIDTAIQGFLDGFMILMGRVEDNASWRLMLIRSMAKLSTVHTPHHSSHSTHAGEHKHHVLGVKCLQLLGFLMQGSPEAEDEILSVIGEIVIEPLADRSQAEVPLNTVQALGKLESQKLPKALSPVIKWLAKMYCDGNGPYPQPDLAHLLAVATCDLQNARDALDVESWTKESSGTLPKMVMTALENKKLYQAEDSREQLLGHLLIVRNTARASPRVVDIYEERQLHRDLIKYFKDFFGDDVDSGETGGRMMSNLLTKRVLNLKTCACLLDAVTPLLGSREVLLDLLNDQHAWGKLDKYLAIAPKASPVADPSLLKASLRGQLMMLNHFPRTDQAQRQQMVLQVIKDLDKMKPILELLDYNSIKYRELFAAAEKHTQELANRKIVNTQAPNFANLHNVLVHGVFEAVVALVGFFSSEAAKDKNCAEVSKVMDDMDRETKLFKLLEIPSEEVQEAVMSCFKQVGTKDMSSDETEYLIRLIASTKDIATEADVLENIILQMCRFADEPDGSTAVLKDHAESAVAEIVNVCLLNSRRNTHGNRTQENQKQKLTQACIAFLQTASLVPDLRSPHMRAKRVTSAAVEILKWEDNLNGPNSPDVVIEGTWTGRAVEMLLPNLTGAERVRARGKVALRVLSRMADVLEGKSDARNAARRNLQLICEREVDFWDDAQIRHQQKFLGDAERDDRQIQQRIFAEYAGLDRLLGFTDGFFKDEEAFREARTEETSTVHEATAFLEKAQNTALEQQGDGAGAASAKQQLLLENESESDLTSEEDDVPVVTFARKEFNGSDAEETDLASPPYDFDVQLGGAMSIYFVARWDALNDGSRILDFGSGSPGDNICIGNIANSNNMTFFFHNGTEASSHKLTLRDCIRVGSVHKFLFTISANGHVKAWRDGAIVGEVTFTTAPVTCRRTHLFLGKSFWSSSHPFRGLIADLKVWQGKTLEWEEVADDTSSDGFDDDFGPDRRHLMEVFLDVDIKHRAPEKQELRGELGMRSTTDLAVNEQLWEEGEENVMNVAYHVAAVLRSFFAMVKVPASERIRRSMVKELSGSLVICRLWSLIHLCGPLDCQVAAKALRLMSTVLEVPHSDTHCKVEVAVACDLAARYYKRFASTAIQAVQQKNHYVQHRGHTLCTEIVRLAHTCCRTATLSRVSDSMIAQRKFAEFYLDHLMPISVVRSIVQMLLHDTEPPTDEPMQGPEPDRNEMWDLSRVLLSQMLDNCPLMKYPILEVFSSNMVSGSVPLRPSFLSALLERSRVRVETAALEDFLNSEEQLARRRVPDSDTSPEKAVMSAKVHVILSGTQLLVSDPSHPDACFTCMVTNKALYIVDVTAPGYPDNPCIVQQREFDDMTRLVKGEAGQVLIIGWVVQVRGRLATEQFMILICHSESERHNLLGKLHALSEPAGGRYKHRTPLQNDSMMRQAFEHKIQEPILLVSFITGDNSSNGGTAESLPLFILSESNIYEFRVNWGKWCPTLQEEAIDEDSSDEKEMAKAETLANSATPKQRPGKNQGPQVQQGQQQALALVPAKSGADAVATRRKEARRRYEETERPSTDKVMNELLFMVIARPLEELSRVAFYPERRPRMELFCDNNQAIEMTFFDDITRENWRRNLMGQLRAFDINSGNVWVRHYEG